ncbi:MAG: RNA polymerase sigma factor [Acidobacteriota bacterium]
MADHPAIAQAVRQIQANEDREAGFRLLYETYYRAVRHLFSRRGFSGAEAEELTQDTFLQVYRYLDGYEHRGSFGAWVFTIAESIERKVRERRRTAKRRAIETPYDEHGGHDDGDPLSRAPRPPAEPATQGRAAYDRQRREILGAVVARLPPRQRQCLELHLRGHTYREIGVLLRIATETVKRHLGAARKTLRDELDDIDLGPLGDPP